MNTTTNRNHRSKALRIVSAAAVSFVTVVGFLSESAIAQQTQQGSLNGVTGTVVRVRLAPTPIPEEAIGVIPVPVPNFVEVGVQVADGATYVVVTDLAHQPRLGESVEFVSTDSGLRITK